MLKSNEQRSDAWLWQRRGKITASRMGDVLAKPDTKRRQEYIADLVADIKGAPDFGMETWAMRYGTEYEDEARRWYEWREDVDVEQTGFTIHSDLPFVGASPDGLVEDDGCVEIKVRTSLSRHLQAAEKMPSVHMPQVQAVMWVMSRQWCDYIDYFPPQRHVLVHRIWADADYQERMGGACRDVWAEVQSRLEKAA